MHYNVSTPKALLQGTCLVQWHAHANTTVLALSKVRPFLGYYMVGQAGLRH